MSKKFTGNNTVKSILRIFKNQLNNKQDLMEETQYQYVELEDIFNGLQFTSDDIAVFDPSEWNYILDENSHTIKLSSYKGSKTDVVVYPRYTINDTLYKTAIISNPSTNISDGYMFNGESSATNKSIKTINIKKGVSTTETYSMAYMFNRTSALTKLTLDCFDLSNVTSLNSIFKNSNISELNIIDSSKFNTSKVTDMTKVFCFCKNMIILDLSIFDCSNVETFESMFYGSNKLETINMSGINAKKVTNMGSMFTDCGALTSIDLSGIDTSNVTTMGSLFANCSSLYDIDVSGFNTHNVDIFNGTFKGCSSLSTLDLSNWDTHMSTQMNGVFDGCTSLTSVDVSSFDTSKVTDMQFMFRNCSSLTSLDLTSFSIKSVRILNSMFEGCTNLTEILVSRDKWVIPEGCLVKDMFKNCGCLEVTYVD